MDHSWSINYIRTNNSKVDSYCKKLDGKQIICGNNPEAAVCVSNVTFKVTLY